MDNHVQLSKSFELICTNDKQLSQMPEDTYYELNKLSLAHTLLQQSGPITIDQSRKKRKQEKKKQRKKKIKLEKIEKQEGKIADLKEIMRKIYQESDAYYRHENKLKQIGQYIHHQSIFLSVLNEVIAAYVQKSLISMDQIFDSCLKSEGIVELEDIISYEDLLSNRPTLFKKLTDCLYYKFIDICRAGTNVHMILKHLRLGFRSIQQEYEYQYLDRDIFQYLTENHQQFKNIILYAYKALVQKTKPLKRVDEQTINRMMEIFKIMRMSVEEELHEDDPELPDSDHSTQEEDVKSGKKKRKNKKKKKSKQTSTDSLICEQQLEVFMSIEEYTMRQIQNLHLCSMQAPIQLSSELLRALSTNKS